MGIVDDRLRTTVSRNAVQSFSGVDKEGLPEISALMAGTVAPGGAHWSRPPFSLLLYLDPSGLKFKFGAGDDHPSLWGQTEGLAGGLLAIEEELCRGRFGTKPAQKNGNGFTHR